ncbi:family 2 glycosyl transferase [Acidovorax sp. NO-1]|nr:family 2 glycosyl transferase [Acidovorax sp. NO-1]
MDTLNCNLTAARTQIENLNRGLSGARAENEAILNSLSWKLTNPLRTIGTCIKIVRSYMYFAKSIIATIGVYRIVQEFFRTLKNEGLPGIQRRVKNAISYYNATGQIYYRTEKNENQESGEIIERIQNEGPKISVIISIYKTPIEMLKQAIESVIQQKYKNWELILVDDFSQSEIIQKLCNSYQENNSNIRYIERSENGNISAANNTGLYNARGSFYTILDHDDILDPSALYEAAKITLEHPHVDYIYSDEDKVTKDGLTFFGPFFKPDWSPEYMLAMMYTCHMSVYRTALVISLGGYNTEFDGAQDYELTLRVVRRSNNVAHIPKVLYHWRVWENSTAQSMEAKPLAHILARRALELHLQELRENFVIGEAVLPGHHFVDFLPKRNSLVSIIIPTANGTIDIRGKTERHLNAVCESIISKTSYKNFEIIVVHNGNLSAEQNRWLASHENIILSEYVAEKFSLSEKINKGAKLANGEYFVIMNDDIRVISEDWLTLMLGMAQREGVGAVGPKLLFPDETIQHAGVVILGGLPGHPYYQNPKNALGYGLGLQVNRNYVAVTGACCMTPRSVFEEIGGYSNKYPLNYNDVDYCLKVRKLGLRSVYIANAHLYHYEGVSKEGGVPLQRKKFKSSWLTGGGIQK